MIQLQTLLDEVENSSKAFREAWPYPHIVVDSLFEPAVADEIVARFPKMESMSRAYNDVFSKKNEHSDVESLGDPFLRQVLDELDGEPFRAFLQKLSGIGDLEADPERHGGGFHQGGDGSFLDIHADFNIQPNSGKHRRVNVLVYLNPGWEEEWGGHLELWDQEKAKHRRVAPLHNRCVIFESTDTSYHGYSKIKVPAGVTRKSIAAYYYTEKAPAGVEVRPHLTMWQAVPSLSPMKRILVPYWPKIVKLKHLLFGKSTGKKVESGRQIKF